MRALVLQAVVEGALWLWLPLLGLWALAAALVLAHRSTRRSVGWTTVALLVASAVSGVALLVTNALSIPRVRLRPVDAPDVVADSGDTWRKLRGPLVAMLVDGQPEVAVPTIDAQGRWVLYGLLEGRLVPGVPEAPPALPEPGASRLCRADGESCRAWPAAWPDPEHAPSVAALAWTKEASADALAYDIETRSFLQPLGGEDTAIEILGRASETAPRTRDGLVRTSLFAIRSVSRGRLRAVRVVAEPAPQPSADREGAPRGLTFKLERADVSVVRARGLVRWFLQPLLALTTASFPLGLLAYALAPAWLLSALRRKQAKRHELEREVVVVPRPGDHAMGELADPIVLDANELPRGALVRLADGSHRGAPITSRAWLEIPRLGAPIGDLVPADPSALRVAASAWMSERLGSLAVLACGVAALSPALVALLAR